MAAAFRVPKPIIALQGASSSTIQSLLAGFAARMQAQRLRVVGVVEVESECGAVGCGKLALRDLSTGRAISISQDLGSGSTACNLDPRGLAEACASVERAIDWGADLVVLSKFGKQEAARGGLGDAFRAAFASNIPIATAVSPAVAADWLGFVGDYCEFATAESGALEAWWSRLQRATMHVAAE
jgi:hypothetical protein